MCEYSKEEFTSGLVKLGVDSMDKLKRKLPELRAELKHDDKYREVYSFAYNFSREVRAAVEFPTSPPRCTLSCHESTEALPAKSCGWPCEELQRTALAYRTEWHNGPAPVLLFPAPSTVGDEGALPY